MKMFKMPKWLKPELNNPMYWVHIGILIAVIYGVMLLWKPIDTVGYLLSSLAGLILGDIIAHTILQLD
jgi:hypothetical protein